MAERMVSVTGTSEFATLLLSIPLYAIFKLYTSTAEDIQSTTDGQIHLRVT